MSRFSSRPLILIVSFIASFQKAKSFLIQITMNFRVLKYLAMLLPLCRLCHGEATSALEGASLEILCKSSFSPVWSWFGPKDGQHRTLSSAGIKPHPKLNEPRYSFRKDGNKYIVQITNVKLGDAGKFVCDGNSYETTFLSVLR